MPQIPPPAPITTPTIAPPEATMMTSFLTLPPPSSALATTWVDKVFEEELEEEEWGSVGNGVQSLSEGGPPQPPTLETRSYLGRLPSTGEPLSMTATTATAIPTSGCGGVVQSRRERASQPPSLLETIPDVEHLPSTRGGGRGAVHAAVASHGGGGLGSLSATAPTPPAPSSHGHLHHHNPIYPLPPPLSFLPPMPYPSSSSPSLTTHLKHVTSPLLGGQGGGT